MVEVSGGWKSETRGDEEDVLDEIRYRDPQVSYGHVGGFSNLEDVWVDRRPIKDY